MPVLLLSAGQAGATAPASLAGTVVQAVAECLVGLIYVNAIKPGAPYIFGTWPFVSDLRTGAMSGGSPEQALLSSACGQMAQFYNLVGGTGAQLPCPHRSLLAGGVPCLPVDDAGGSESALLRVASANVRNAPDRAAQTRPSWLAESFLAGAIPPKFPLPAGAVYWHLLSYRLRRHPPSLQPASQPALRTAPPRRHAAAGLQPAPGLGHAGGGTA